MNLLKFHETFKTEADCKLHFKSFRDQLGVVCSKCQSSKHYWISSIEMYECSSCKYRTSLKKGTILENSKLKFRTWYLIMLFMSATKKGFSAAEIQRQLGKKRYEPIWRAMHKIRQAMGQRDDRYKLEDMVEFDDAFFETYTPKKEKQKLKRGRGSQRQTKVAVAAESTILEDLETGKLRTSCRYFKMKVNPEFTKNSSKNVVTAIIDKDSVLNTDKSTSYVNISDFVEVHVMTKSGKETTNTTLKWTHIAISNAKRNLLGVYHMVKSDYLQNYLNEFVYRLNRRYFGESLFERVVLAVSTAKLQTSG